MLKVGLTGGIACGKSLVAEMFAERGAHVAKADEIAHRLMLQGASAYDEIVRRFGRGILAKDGTIDRAKLSDIVFAKDHPRIEELNAIVHPAVIAEQDRWAEQIGREDRNAVVVIEAALIFEAKLRDHFDRLVVVTCNPEQKVERLAKRLQIDMEKARAEERRRSAAQLPDSEKVSRADYVIHNTGSIAELRQQADRLFDVLKREAETQI